MKMLVSDYDNTFYTNDNDIFNNIFGVSKFRKNNLFVIATGRSYPDFYIKKEEYGIEYDYLVLNHGATILKNGNIIYNETIDNEVKNKIISSLDFSIVVDYFICSYTGKEKNTDLSDVTKIMIEFVSLDVARDIYNKLMDNFSDYVMIFFISSNKSLEIVSKNVNKVKAIRFIQKIENFKDDDIYTIGDNYTDLEMIKKYNGYCMKNSVLDVKKAAIMEIESVSDLIDLIIGS